MRSAIQEETLAAGAVASRSIVQLGQPDGGGTVCRVGGDSRFSGRN